MRVRNIVAAGLSVFLAVVSSWASACDLSCSLQRMADGCDDRAASSAGSSKMASSGSHCGRASQAGNRDANSAAYEMADMPGMTTSHADAGRVESMPQVADGSQPCSRSSLSASVAAETSRYEFKGASFVGVMFVNIGELTPVMGVRSAGTRGAPPPRFTALSPLSISLRI